MQWVNFDVRRAGPTDVNAIAAAHLDSIHSIGSRHYSPDIVSIWSAQVTPSLYLDAMAGGEVFFIAVGVLDGESEASGFSSHRVDDGTHGVSVYVRGSVARRGIGSALLRSAEADTISTVATSIRIDASLAAVEFYRAHGYAELSRGMVDLVSGHRMPCVFMRKDFAAT